MVDLSEFASSSVPRLIEEHYVKRYGNEQSRNYLGASIIGKECERALWYDFRWVDKKTFSGRMYRLFQTGHLAEQRLVEDLRAIGAEVHDVNPADGKQFGFSDHGGHMKGHMDGCGRWIPEGGKKWHVLEFKTSNDKGFKEMTGKGVKLSEPQHYAQMQWYMGQSGMERALYMMVNKNTDEIWAERVPFDRVHYEQLQAKALRVIFAATPPARIRDDANYYLCNMCDYKAVCHQHKAAALSCRTCVHATPEPDGEARWSCAKAEDRSNSIPIYVQRSGCPKHLPLPFLLTYAEPIDAGEDWIEFKRKDNGEEFVVLAQDATPPTHKPLGYVYRSAEVCSAENHKAICNQDIENFRTTFGATIIA